MEPRDFIVEEIIDLKKEDKGRYLYIKLKKENWNTLDIIDRLSKILKINKKNIGYAGLKDKNAITTQYISLFNVSKKKVEKIKIKDVSLEILFYGDKDIKLGDLIGNKFKIKIDFKPISIDFCENYFGEQRFGGNNFEVGVALLKEDFGKALNLMKIEYIGKDYLKYLRKINKRLLTLYIHSVQSYFWNNVVSEYLKEKNIVKFKKISIPLISFDVEFKDKLVEKIYLDLLDKYNLKLGDFVIRKLPEIIPTSVGRDVFVKVKDFKYSNGYVSFELGKGSYATVVLKKLENYINVEK